MVEKGKQKLWDSLQGRKAHMPHFLHGMRIQGIRGIDDLRLAFEYPVSVLAGGNACGKSTALLAAACAYKVPGAGVRDYVPSAFFPDDRSEAVRPNGERGGSLIEFDYSTPEGRLSMQWRRSKSWSRSFFGRRGASQPERRLHCKAFDTPGYLFKASGFPGMARTSSQQTRSPFTPSQLDFAQRMLPFRYSEVVELSRSGRNMLVATQERGLSYPESQMSSGERAILRLAQKIAHLDGGLLLIDQVEAGLHPWAHGSLMLLLQQLALRKDLQIIVTTHSPVVLNAVPPHGRTFLERDAMGRIAASPAYRDVVQNALYGHASDALNVLCEDEVSEGILRGVCDILIPRQGMRQESVRIGCDPDASELPARAATLRMFGQIHNFVFVLDGDKRDDDLKSRIQAQSKMDVPVFFLPGRDSAEVWTWKRLRGLLTEQANDLGISPGEHIQRMERLDTIYDVAADAPAVIAEFKLNGLAETLGRNVRDLCRAAARTEAARKESDIQPLVEQLEGIFLQWRSE